MSNFIDNYTRILGEGKVVGTQIYFPCPFSGCRDYIGQDHKFNVNIETGRWYCFRCRQAVPDKVYPETATEHAGGTALEFMELMDDIENIELWLSAHDTNEFEVVEPLPKREAYKIWTKLFSLCPLASDHRKIIEDRGIDPDLLGAKSACFSALAELEKEFGRDKIIAAGLCFSSKEGIDFPTLCIQTGRILIPYFNEKKTRVIYFVGYQKVPDKKYTDSEEDYQKIKSRWCKIAGPKGHTPIPYGLQQIPKGSPFLVLQEGQLKSASTSQRGIPSIGLQGMGSLHRTVAKAIAERNIGAVIILFDNQTGHEKDIDIAAESIARELLVKDVPCFRATLPLPEGLEKIDTDLYLLYHTAEELGEILLSSIQTPYIFREETDDS